jgi:hypothetical protein
VNPRESQWIGEQMAAVPDAELFPLLDVGSSTEEFRTKMQPHVDANVFAPLRKRGGKVWHLDQKANPGVDLVGDLADPAFQARVRALEVRSALMSNLFEHVTDRQALADLVLGIIPPGGYIFVSGPHRYPYHPDPLDTMFRPTPQEMAAYFPGTTVVNSAIIADGSWRRGGRSLPRTLARLLVPVYRPAQWVQRVRETPYLFKEIKAFGLVLRKQK